MLPLLLRSKVNTWRVVGIGAVVALILMALYVYGLTVQLKRDQVVYQNPATITRTVTKRVEGPIRIVTRIVREPGGRTEETREEVRGAVVETRGTEAISTPVFAPKVYSRFIGVQRVWDGPLKTKDVAIYGGVTVFRRIDLGGGVTGQGKGFLTASWRF